MESDLSENPERRKFSEPRDLTLRETDSCRTEGVQPPIQCVIDLGAYSSTPVAQPSDSVLDDSREHCSRVISVTYT